MKTMIPPTIVVCACLLSCAHATRLIWLKPDATTRDFAVDKYACTQESRTSWTGGGTGLSGAMAMGQARSEAREESSRMFKLCMEARGWVLCEEPKKNVSVSAAGEAALSPPPLPR